MSENKGRLPNKPTVGNSDAPARSLNPNEDLMTSGPRVIATGPAFGFPGYDGEPKDGPARFASNARGTQDGDPNATQFDTDSPKNKRFTPLPRKAEDE